MQNSLFGSWGLDSTDDTDYRYRLPTTGAEPWMAGDRSREGAAFFSQMFGFGGFGFGVYDDDEYYDDRYYDDEGYYSDEYYDDDYY